MRSVVVSTVACALWLSCGRWVDAADQDKAGPPAKATAAAPSAPEPTAVERKIAAVLETEENHPKTAITARSEGIAPASAVRTALARRRMRFLVRDGRPLITTEKIADSTVTIRLYPIDDLVTVPGKEVDGGEKAKELQNLIESMVVPETWITAGGDQGNIVPYAGSGITLPAVTQSVGSSRVDLQACKLEYSIVSPK